MNSADSSIRRRVPKIGAQTPAGDGATGCFVDCNRGLGADR